MTDSELSRPVARPKAPTILAKGAGGRALLFEYQSGEGLPPHTHAGQTVVVAVLRGQLQLTVAEDTQVHKAGEVVTLHSEGLFSSVALENDTHVLITLLEN